MLVGSEESGDGTEQDKSNPHDRRKLRRGVGGRNRKTALRCEKAEKQSKARDHEAESHDGKAGPDPGEERTFRSKVNARIRHVVG
jgi:hypothetical protein